MVSVLIITWNRKNSCANAIDSVYRQTYPNLEIIIIDNGSSDGTKSFLKNIYPNLRIISYAKNLGCPEGRNRGIQFCHGEYIFFLDDDGILHEDAIANAMWSIKEFPDAGVISGKVIDIADRDINSSYKQNHKIYEVGIFQGGICLHKKRLFNEIGCYPEDYMYGGEESFLSYKLIDNNIRILKNESVILYHPINNIIDKSESHRRSFENVFITAYQLFPAIILYVFIIYYSFAYLYYSHKYGFLCDYFKMYKHAIVRAKRYKRTPIKISSYWKFNKLNHKLTKIN